MHAVVCVTLKRCTQLLACWACFLFRRIQLNHIGRPLDSGAASSAACRQGKKDIGRSWEKKEKKGKKEEEDKDDDLTRGEMMVEE